MRPRMKKGRWEGTILPKGSIKAGIKHETRVFIMKSK